MLNNKYCKSISSNMTPIKALQAYNELGYEYVISDDGNVAYSRRFDDMGNSILQLCAINGDKAVFSTICPYQAVDSIREKMEDLIEGANKVAAGKPAGIGKFTIDDEGEISYRSVLEAYDRRNMAQHIKTHILTGYGMIEIMSRSERLREAGVLSEISRLARGKR